jgi:hypothetical protein
MNAFPSASGTERSTHITTCESAKTDSVNSMRAMSLNTLVPDVISAVFLKKSLPLFQIPSNDRRIEECKE